MNSENTLMIKTAFAVAHKMKASAVLLHVDPLDDLTVGERVVRKHIDLILLSRKKKLDENSERATLATIAKAIIPLPRIGLTRVALIKIATTLAISGEIVEPGTKLVFAVGQADQGLIDLIQVVDMAKESDIVAGKGLAKISEVVNPEIFQAILNLTIELADKGREGKPVGTIFVLGDHEKVLQLSRQMILNPFKGYEEEDRHILSPALKETIREFSAMDGAFIIADDGTVLTAGRYLGAASAEANLPRGLGSRHIAAAGITSLTRAIAFAISESSGDVRIFKDGKIIMHIEKSPTKK